MKKIIIIFAVVLVGVAVYLFSKNNGGMPAVSPTPTPTPVSSAETTPTPSPASETPKTTILYSDSGYSPSTVNIKKGDAVIFKNTAATMMWPASAMHPTHKLYPGTGIEKCGTSAQDTIFDACKGYASGGSWEFRFNESGTWKYHNHLQPSHFGTIIVE